jgi:hypothetical protein
MKGLAALAAVSIGCGALAAAGAEQRNPFETDEAAIRIGSVLFAARCSDCHGPDAKQRQADLRLEVNRATRNNVFGLILPNAVIPGISGPVQDESTIASTFGSPVGVWLSGELLTCLRRRMSASRRR